MEKITMQYRELGKTGLKVSVVGIETHQWSGMGGRFFTVAEIRAILRRAEKAGMNFIDTGECYFFHAAERMVGDALGKNRRKWIIATKFGHISRPKEIVSAWTGEDIRKQLDDSLAALRTDYIDLYQLHVNAPEDIAHIRANTLNIRDALAEAKKAGKIRAVGVCLGDDALFGEDGVFLQEAVEMLSASAVQVVYNRLDRKAEERIFPFAKKHNLGIIARVPLAKGYLSTRFKPLNKTYDEVHMKKVEEIKQNEMPVGADLSEWAIGWCVKNPSISCVVPGHSAPMQIDATVRAAHQIFI